jgi:galactokinase
VDAVELFRSRYGTAPHEVVRAPGRVNLIGEHLDYTLLPVLPVAMQHGITVAATRTANGRVRATSANVTGELDLDLEDSAVPAGWHRYVWAAAREAGSSGAEIAVAGDLLADGGLSSSSALTVALIAALSDLAGDALVLAASRAERAVGIEGGLMDQSVIVHGRPGTALRIEFDPLRHRTVPIPSSIRIVAAHSGQRAPKSAAIRDAFDVRVSGGRVAAALLGVDLGVDPGRPPLLGRIAHTAGIDDAITRLPETLVPDTAPADLEDLVRFTARRLDPAEPVPVRAVAEHVIGEARRVDAVEAALVSGEIGEVGRLLDASHVSLIRYGATTAALDAVCAAMRRAGAAGARMTGAGWGGFAVAVCDAAAVDAVIRAAIEETGGPAFEVVPSGGMRR